MSLPPGPVRLLSTSCVTSNVSTLMILTGQLIGMTFPSGPVIFLMPGRFQYPMMCSEVDSDQYSKAAKVGRLSRPKMVVLAKSYCFTERVTVGIGVGKSVGVALGNGVGVAVGRAVMVGASVGWREMVGLGEGASDA